MAYVTRTFPKEVMQRVLWEGVDGFKVVENEMFDTSRWSIHYKLVFEHEGKFYETSYSRGATESQDEQPFEYDDDDIECNEVALVEKVIKVYEVINV